MKILVVLPRFPYPLEKGDKLRAYHQIRCLSEKHDIILAALHEDKVSDEALQQVQPFCQRIYLLHQPKWRSFTNIIRSFFNGTPLQCGYFYSKKNHREIKRILREEQPDRIYCQLFRMAEYVKDVPIQKVIDFQDAFSKGMWRRYENANLFLKPFFKMEWRRVSRYEEAIFDKFDDRTIITEVDRNLIPHPRRDEIVVVPNGVDFNQFAYHGETKSYDLIFSGNMGYAPNVDAAEYLAKEIMPSLWPEFPDLRLVLCGANPAPKVRALQSDHVLVTGWVDSMAGWYAQAKVFIAPMRMGTGLQNKLLEAMSMQLPCVTSPLAAKPLSGAESENAIRVCHNTHDYVETIRQLLKDNTEYQHLATAGNRFVHDRYDWETAAEKLLQIISR
jgi:sugar transferase (PEP-CTERM/EpsH1 system associated)